MKNTDFRELSDSEEFLPEEQMIKHGQKLIDDKVEDPQILLSEYTALFRQFEKFVEQTNKIIRISDHSQERLITTNKQVLDTNKELSNQIEKSKIFVNLGENIAGLIHNMKGDLGILTISIGILEEQSDNPAIEFIKNGIKQLEAKISNILTLAKYSQNDEDIEFSINALLDSLIEIFSINKNFKKIKIEKKYNEYLSIYGNTSEISQVFENLINNAYEAMIENWNSKKESGETAPVPVLELCTDKVGDEGVISFTDNGPGMASCFNCSCNKDCIECTAFKIGKTTKTSGTGLGMISVFRSVTKYKGKVRIKTSSTGSSISVTLPITGCGK